MIKDKDLFWSLIIFFSIVILCMSFAYVDYKITEKELSQPKYYIEINQESYELEKISLGE